MTFRFFDGRLDIEISWDHGPELWITLYGRRTQIIMLSWNAYPVLGQTDHKPPHFFGVLERMSRNYVPRRLTDPPEPYTIEDLYRDSPTETPFRKIQPDHESLGLLEKQPDP